MYNFRIVGNYLFCDMQAVGDEPAQIAEGLRKNVEIHLTDHTSGALVNVRGLNNWSNELIIPLTNITVESESKTISEFITWLTTYTGNFNSPELGAKFDTPTGLTNNRVPKWNGSTFVNTGMVQVNGNYGFGSATTPGELIHIGDGNMLLEGGGEVAQKFKRDFTASGENLGVPTGSGQSVNPIFQVGRIIEAGDGDPEIRFMYSDDNTSERTVFEVDRKGIVASVKTAIGSHFEGFKSLTDVNPMFRLNSYPRMRLEMGAGGNSATDVAVERDASGGVAVFTNSTSKVVVSSDGDIEVQTASKGIILKAPNDTRWRVTVNNSGNLVTTQL